jgi:hypothetical protein
MAAQQSLRSAIAAKQSAMTAPLSMASVVSALPAARSRRCVIVVALVCLCIVMLGLSWRLLSRHVPAGR